MKYLIILLTVILFAACNDGHNVPDDPNDDDFVRPDTTRVIDTVRIDTVIHASLRDELELQERLLKNDPTIKHYSTDLNNVTYLSGTIEPAFSSGNIKCIYYGTEWWDACEQPYNSFIHYLN